MTDPWHRPQSPWRVDEVFCRVAEENWSDDYALATTRNENGSLRYDKGAAGKLRYRYQGWLAGLLAASADRSNPQ